MRQLLSFAIIISTIAAAMSGCAPSAASDARPTPSGEFRVLMPARPSTLNPNLVLDEIAIVLGRNIFNQLLSLNETGRLIPELAASWTVSPDGLTYTFHLRDGVRWHDGQPFTSDDVLWTLEMVEKNGFAGREALAPVATKTAPDRLTVVITLKYAWAPFATDLAGPGISILPRHVYAGSDWRKHPANERPIGTGPFKFSGWIDDDAVALVANQDYFGSGPYVERVVFRAVRPDVITDALLRGEADYTIGRPIGLDLSNPPNPLSVRMLPTSGRLYLSMNLRREPFDEPRVRRALAAVIDRVAIVSGPLGGIGAPAVGWYTPDVEWAYNANARLPEYDVAGAAALLDAAGLPMKNGERFRTTLIVPDVPPIRDVADMLRRQFAQIGVGVTVERVPTADWPKRTIVAHDFDLTLVAGNQGPDPDQLRRRFLASSDNGAYIGYDAPDFREALEQGARQLDVAGRAASYRRAQDILARDVPFIPLTENVKVIVHNRRVSGLPQLEARGLVGSFDFSLVKLGTTRQSSMR